MTERIVRQEGIDQCVSHVDDRSPSTDDIGSLTELVANSIDNFVGIWNEDLRTLFLNRKARSLLGLESEQDVSDTRVQDYVDAADLPLLQTAVLPALQREGCWWGEVRLRHGERFSTTTWSSP